MGKTNAEAEVLEIGLKVPHTTAMLCKDYTRMMLVFIQASTVPVLLEKHPKKKSSRKVGR